MKRVASVALLLLLLTVSLLAGATPREPAPASIQGTVQSLQPERGTLEVVTGVGMSLRLVRLTVPPSLKVRSGGGAGTLSALKRGDIVRVQCHRSGRQLMADRIQKVGTR